MPKQVVVTDDLEPLTTERWVITPSLCDGWTVHDAVAHVVDTAKTSKLSFARDMLMFRFDFDLRKSPSMPTSRTAKIEG